MHYYIGIDDTDNLESRGTGHRARQLGTMLEEAGIARLICITRHQLLVHKDIPYTSHNSSACLLMDCEPAKEAEITTFCRDFLLRESAPGSDAGLCIASAEVINNAVENWGKNAKKIVLNKPLAHELANLNHIFLEGLTGEKIGVIGALAAVGLRHAGNDGRVLWLPLLRETEGIFSASELKNRLKVDRITTREGKEIHNLDTIKADNWIRPVMRENKITLIVEKSEEHEQYKWQHVPKEYIKSISN
jgi:predicted GIY-YIG superfamily endonuclease